MPKSKSTSSIPAKGKRTLIIAFDTASHDTGIAIKFSDGSPVKPDGSTLIYGEIKLASKNIESRCGQLHERVTHMLHRLVPHERAVVVLEQARPGRFQAVYAALRCAQCAVWCACQETAIPIRYVSPIQTRVALGLRPNASKQDIDREVRKLFKINKGVSDNITDAIGIAEAYARGKKTSRVVRKIEHKKEKFDE